MAALRSQSISSPQAAQRKTRRDSWIRGPTHPHWEHCRVDGKPRGATMRREPYQAHLYSSIRRKAPHPTSWMARERFSFRTRPRTHLKILQAMRKQARRTKPWRVESRLSCRTVHLRNPPFSHPKNRWKEERPPPSGPLPPIDSSPCRPESPAATPPGRSGRPPRAPSP